MEQLSRDLTQLGHPHVSTEKCSGIQLQSSDKTSEEEEDYLSCSNKNCRLSPDKDHVLSQKEYFNQICLEDLEKNAETLQTHVNQAEENW